MLAEPRRKISSRASRTSLTRKSTPIRFQQFDQRLRAFGGTGRACVPARSSAWVGHDIDGAGAASVAHNV